MILDSFPYGATPQACAPGRLPFVGANRLAGVLDTLSAVAALESELLNGIDPEGDAARLFSPVAAGEFLVMPAESSRYAGIKVVTLAPSNPSKGRPKVQGTYLLFDAATLTPQAAFDAAELTLIRTSAVTAMAVKHMIAAGGGGSIGTLAVIGTSVQADRHIGALTAVCGADQIVVVGRRDHAAEALASKWAARGLPARAGGPADIPDADVIICATSSSTPVMDGSTVSDRAIVAAIGSHGLENREIDAVLARRADIVVEGRASAFRESGNLLQARTLDQWKEIPVTNLAELVAGRFKRQPATPALYTAVGMAWEDLVLATRAFELINASGPESECTRGTAH